jgi:hypothetical protein
VSEIDEPKAATTEAMQEKELVSKSKRFFFTKKSVGLNWICLGLYIIDKPSLCTHEGKKLLSVFVCV